MKKGLFGIFSIGVAGVAYILNDNYNINTKIISSDIKNIVYRIVRHEIVKDLYPDEENVRFQQTIINGYKKILKDKELAINLPWYKHLNFPPLYTLSVYDQLMDHWADKK